MHSLEPQRHMAAAMFDSVWALSAIGAIVLLGVIVFLIVHSMRNSDKRRRPNSAITEVHGQPGGDASGVQPR